ncbi:hypothetical protein C1645_814914 [Glomus cerebriforme]|uniref:Galactose oxidase n=1 Tax=Glomus cerebriforme TaxID=658196 RepID=A0A397TNW2_9GLOM|nr:hypothetical protein C1645_814914 [Glomus cerebriforme]
MFQKSLASVLLWVLFQLLVEINCQMTPFTPKQRELHTATLINNKLYILGGDDLHDKPIIGKEFFYLDVSVSFNTQELSWNDLSSIDIVPPHTGATAVKVNSTLFLYGGRSDGLMATLYTYDLQGNTWSIPTVTGINSRKELLTGIVDHNGKIYLWSGLLIDADGKEGNLVNDMLILNTINLSWEQGSLIGAPTARYYYGAVLLPNNNIIYTGGYDNKAELTLSQIYIYDTINDNWTVKTASGQIPSGRDGFSTVLGLDGQRVIIFGGANTFDYKNFVPEDSLYILNIMNFEWYIPKVSGPIPKTPMFHRANIIGNYMVVSFGYGYDAKAQSDILLLDISNNDEYIWTYNFVPSPSSPSSPSSTSQSVTQSSTLTSSPTNSPTLPQPTQSNKSLPMIGAILGSLFGGILFSFGCFFLYKWNKNKQKDVIPPHYDLYNQDEMIIPKEINIHDFDATNHEPMIPAPVITNRNYNNAQVVNNNERVSSQDLDDLKNVFRQEIQNLRQEILQNNRQTSVSNITRNNNNLYNY